MKFWLSPLMIFLIIANFLAIYYLDHTTDRWFRFGTTIIFLLLYLFKYFSKYRLLIIFLLFAIVDGLLVYYEIPFLKKIIYTVRIIAYLNLILFVVPSLSSLKLNFFTIAISAFIISIDIYLIHEMAESLPEIDQSPVFLFLFYFLGMISLALVATSLSYLNRYADRKAFFLMIASGSCFLIFSFIMHTIWTLKNSTI
ncbi:hypothetical protein [Christiangramia sediminis]|uniref:Uncharacterized protein n=1 Tax=Christiangramia sediminis TaxID=2881336 RepID=A0A9X1RXB6_9FLAO|nr:hypothetical protein [Christiangramia sediminis]MCB7481401.1 hypothetical protein [Christiangramia sediminis]